MCVSMMTTQDEVWCWLICHLQIRLAEAQLQGDSEKLKSETQEKLKKIEGWRAELKLLEDKKAPTGS